MKNIRVILRKAQKEARRLWAQIIKISHMRYARDWRIWAGVGLFIFIIVFWALPTFTAKAPGQLGYGIKRFEESVATAVAPTNGLRDRLKLNFATRRIEEASYVAAHTHSNSGKVYAATADIAPENTKAAATVSDLVTQFSSTYKEYTTKLAAAIDKGKKPQTEESERLRKQSAQVYAALALLRVEAPDAAQGSVLGGIDTIQNNIATVNDALNKTPLSASDVSQLTKLVSVGILPKADLNTLLNSDNNNRQFYTKLEELVNADKLPSDLFYSLDQDLIKQLSPKDLASFEAVTQFEQMQRISAAIQSSRPTVEQQQAIQEYLSKYKAGQAVPTNDIRPFVVPIVYGMSISGHLQANLASIGNVRMNSDDQALYDSWKGTLTGNQRNLGELYQKLMTAAADQPNLHTRVMARVEQELVDAQKADVSHLVMPPGWGADNLPALSRQMSTELAEAKFIEANPDTSQQLANLATTQQSLQSALDAIAATNTSLNTKLEAHITNVNGNTEQLSTLKETFTTLKDTQTNTISELRTQVDTINEARTTLGTSIEKLRSEQLVSLTELRLRGAANTKELTESVRTELTKQLTVLEQQNQTLVKELQTKVDSLGAGQTQLRTELTTSIHNIQTNQTEVEAYLQAQIDSGKATSNQLQTTLQSFQTTLTQQQNDITNVQNTTNALTSLVNEVKDTSQAQANQLQGQVDSLRIDQQNIKSSIETLAAQQSAELEQLTSQVSQLSILQAEAQTTIENIRQEQTTAQTTINQLSQDVTATQAEITSIQEAYTLLQSDISAQQSELASWQEQTQSTVDQLTQQQAQLAGQVEALNAKTTNLDTSLTSLQATSTATQAQLDELLATQPWATIPEGTYVDQAQFDALARDLNAQFAQKAAELDAQFQAYQQQLNGEVQQLRDTTDAATAERAQLQQTVDELRTQLNALQAQLEATSPTGEPTL